MDMMRIDDLLTEEEKRAILHGSKQDKIIANFKDGMASKYKPPRHNADPLDQAITVAITQKEKDYIKDELKEVRKTGGKTTVSAFCRKRTVTDLDVIQWREFALDGIKILNSPNWNKRSLESKKATAHKRLSSLKPDDIEGKKLYQQRIQAITHKLELLEKPEEKRNYRIKIRFTYKESKQIRWRAARLSLTVADYIRFILFDYRPNSQDDRSMSVNYRRRFYLGILDVSKVGWGTPPEEGDEQTAKYIERINELERKLQRLRNVLTPSQVKKLNQQH